MIAWMSALALAASPEGGAVQRIHELEWSRGEVLGLASQMAGTDDPTRAAAMIAAGRLRSEDALSLLVSGKTDPSPEVQRAAAEALAWTPGAAPAIRTWLREVERPSTVLARAEEERGVVVALLEALGHQGDATDLPTLTAWLQEPWPAGAAAARALGRMGVRKVKGADGTADELVARLGAVDPRVGADVAWALSRVGMAAASPEAVGRVVARVQARDTYALTRARLVKAAWPELDAEQRGSLFVDLATDPSKLVRVALFTALEPGDAAPELLAPWLVDRDPWIRQTALEAMGRDPQTKTILAEQRAQDAYDRAALVRAQGGGAPPPEGEPPIVRAAYAGAITDRAQLEALAADDPEPMVRTAAVSALLEAESTRASSGVRLLASRDPVIREAAIELVTRAPREERIATLVKHLTGESNADVLTAGAKALTAAGPRRPQVEPALAALAKSRDPRVARAGADLARAVGAPAPAAAPPAWPSVEGAEKVRRAIVVTSEGTFVIALDPDVAPLAVANFAALARKDFFDGLVFHRVVPGFVIQTGCPRGDGWGGPGYVLPDEVSATPFDTGAVGMARSDRDTGGSQWFVTTSPQPHLVGEYTWFGRVVQGMHVVQEIKPGSQLLDVRIVEVGGSP